MVAVPPASLSDSSLMSDLSEPPPAHLMGEISNMPPVQLLDGGSEDMELVS